MDTNLYFYLYLYEWKLKVLPRQIRSWELRKNEVCHHYHHHHHHSDRHETGQPVIRPESLTPVVLLSLQVYLAFCVTNVILAGAILVSFCNRNNSVMTGWSKLLVL